MWHMDEQKIMETDRHLKNYANNNYENGQTFTQLCKQTDIPIITHTNKQLCKQTDILTIM